MHREQNTFEFYPAVAFILIVLSFSAVSFADTAKTQYGFLTYTTDKLVHAATNSFSADNYSQKQPKRESGDFLTVILVCGIFFVLCETPIIRLWKWIIRRERKLRWLIFYPAIAFILIVLFFSTQDKNLMYFIIFILILLSIIYLIIEFWKWIKTIFNVIFSYIMVFILILLSFFGVIFFSAIFKDYIESVGLLLLILILLYVIHLIIQLWKYRRLNEESIKFFNQKEIDKEIIRLEEDIEITKKEFGIKHPNYLKTFDKLASVYYSIKDYEQAEIVYDVVLEIKEEVYGKKHPEYVKSLNELSNLYILTREFHKAEPLTQQSLKLNIEVYGKKHPEYIKSLVVVFY